MKKLLTIATLLVLGTSFAQINIGQDYADSYFRTQFAESLFDDNTLTASSYPDIGINFTEDVQIDSVTIWNITTGTSQYVELEWRYKSNGTWSSATTEPQYQASPLGSITIDLTNHNIIAESFLIKSIVSDGGTNIVSWTEIQVWGNSALISSTEQNIKTPKEKTLIATYDINGNSVDPKTKGLVIYRYSDGSTEKIFNQ